MYKVLVNHLGGLSLPRKSVVRLTDHPDMTLGAYPGPKKTTTVKLSNNTISSISQVQYFSLKETRTIPQRQTVVVSWQFLHTGVSVSL